MASRLLVGTRRSFCWVAPFLCALQASSSPAGCISFPRNSLSSRTSQDPPPKNSMPPFSLLWCCGCGQRCSTLTWSWLNGLLGLPAVNQAELQQGLSAGTTIRALDLHLHLLLRLFKRDSNMLSFPCVLLNFKQRSSCDPATTTRSITIQYQYQPA